MSARTIDYEKYVLIEAMDYDINNNLVYYGRAFAGAKKEDAGWQIKKIIYDANNNPIDVLWAEGNDVMDKVWNNRANYEYK